VSTVMRAPMDAAAIRDRVFRSREMPESRRMAPVTYPPYGVWDPWRRFELQGNAGQQAGMEEIVDREKDRGGRAYYDSIPSSARTPRLPPSICSGKCAYARSSSIDAIHSMQPSVPQKRPGAQARTNYSWSVFAGTGVGDGF
jgi:hypothetical protein